MPAVVSDQKRVLMSTMRESLYPFEILLHRSPDEPSDHRRAVRTADIAKLALDQEYEQLGISGELVLIDHDQGHVILERRQLPVVEREAAQGSR